MNFARKILDKYGWKDGDGLGKNSDGIAKPLKAKLKFDNAGFGADQAASDFNNHWWDRVYKDASQNVDVKKGKSGVSLTVKDCSDGVEITTKSYSAKKLKKANEKSDKVDSERYGNFLLSSVLTRGGDEMQCADKVSVSDIAMAPVSVLTDEELFRACGGRTAHKGARHGLKLSGKLSRLEQQEKELLAMMQTKYKGSDSAIKKTENPTNEEIVKKPSATNVVGKNMELNNLVEGCEFDKSKKRKNSTVTQDESSKKKKRNKKKSKEL